MNVLAAFDVDDLIKLVVFVIFFALPVVKSIRDAKKKQEEERRRLDRAPTTGTSSEDEGRAAWEALLRGEPVATSKDALELETVETAQAPHAVPAPSPAPRRTFEEVTPERPYAPELARETELSRVPRGVLSSEGAAAEGREVLTESAPLTRTRPLTSTEPLTAAPALTDTPALDTAGALTDTPAFEGTSLAELVSQGGYRGLDVAAAAEPGARGSRRMSLSRAELRRAIVLQEVLGPPVSLRRAHLADAGAVR